MTLTVLLNLILARGMFNGILTGQCQEIMLPTKSFDGVQDLYKWHSDGEIALCHLMAICAGRVSEEEYEDVAYYTLLMADNAISIMDYPFESLATLCNFSKICWCWNY